MWCQPLNTCSFAPWRNVRCWKVSRNSPNSHLILPGVWRRKRGNPPVVCRVFSRGQYPGRRAFQIQYGLCVQLPRVVPQEPVRFAGSAAILESGTSAGVQLCGLPILVKVAFFVPELIHDVVAPPTTTGGPGLPFSPLILGMLKLSNASTFKFSEIPLLVVSSRASAFWWRSSPCVFGASSRSISLLSWQISQLCRRLLASHPFESTRSLLRSCLEEDGPSGGPSIQTWAQACLHQQPFTCSPDFSRASILKMAPCLGMVSPILPACPRK